MTKNKKYSCDFETSTWNMDETYVWAWAICDLENLETHYGNNIDSFMEYIFNLDNPKLFFHNLKFDGSFLLNWLFRNNFEWVADKKERKDNSFLTLITDKGQWYKITIYLKIGKKPKYIEIYDSLKKLPFSVKSIAESFKLPILKGEIDYEEYRSEEHIMSDEERSYIKNDVEIVARALDILEAQGMSKMTTSANALNNYKQILGNKNFERYFPKLPPLVDEYIRKTYKGGFTYVNDRFKNKNIGKGIVLDVNSLYPSRMKFERLPIGKPIYFKGKYQTNENYPLYVQQISCIFELKDNYIPTIQIKNNRWRFSENEYLKSSYGERVVLTLTNVDLELFFEHYEVYELKFMDGFMFRSCKGMFSQYIDYWTEQKIKAKKEGNGGLYTLSKLMLNSLYGKFGTNPKSALKIPYLSDEGILKFKLSEVTERDSIYIPIASFITAYARNYTIRSAQKVYDRFMYADTDSLHLRGFEIPKGLKVDDYELGAWKHESSFDRAFYIRQKCYIENEIKTIKDVKKNKEKYEEHRKKRKMFHVKHLNRNYKIKGIRQIKVTVSGLPEQLRKYVNFENFREGLVIDGKLTQKQVKGGALLSRTTFEIKKV